MIKNIIIGILIVITLYLSYIMFALSTGERPVNVVEHKSTPTQELKTYKSAKFGITFNYPKELKVEETTGEIKISGKNVSIELTDKRGANINNYIKWSIQSHAINEVMTSDESKHIVLNYQTSSPESADTHIFIENYPAGLNDDGSNKHIIIAKTLEGYSVNSESTDTRPMLVNEIMGSLKFTN